MARVSSFLVFAADIHVARHVDIDGIGQEDSASSTNYMHTVDNARLLVRTLEAVFQSIYDDCSVLLLTVQSVRDCEAGQEKSRQEMRVLWAGIDLWRRRWWCDEKVSGPQETGGVVRVYLCFLRLCGEGVWFAGDGTDYLDWPFTEVAQRNGPRYQPCFMRFSSATATAHR